jgi:hypothetical protein
LKPSILNLELRINLSGSRHRGFDRRQALKSFRFMRSDVSRGQETHCIFTMYRNLVSEQGITLASGAGRAQQQAKGGTTNAERAACGCGRVRLFHVFWVVQLNGCGKTEAQLAIRSLDFS